MPNGCQDHNIEWLAGAMKGSDWKGQSRVLHQFYVKSVMKYRYTDTDPTNLLLWICRSSYSSSLLLTIALFVSLYKLFHQTEHFFDNLLKCITAAQLVLTLRGFSLYIFLSLFPLSQTHAVEPHWADMSRVEPGAEHALSLTPLSHGLTLHCCFL